MGRLVPLHYIIPLLAFVRSHHLGLCQNVTNHRVEDFLLRGARPERQFGVQCIELEEVAVRISLVGGANDGGGVGDDVVLVPPHATTSAMRM